MKAKQVTVAVTIDAETKRDAELIFKSLGLTTSAAINIFLRQVVLQRALPFYVSMPENNDPENLIAPR